jgi:hypothetical protein
VMIEAAWRPFVGAPTVSAHTQGYYVVTDRCSVSSTMHRMHCYAPWTYDQRRLEDVDALRQTAKNAAPHDMVNFSFPRVRFIADQLVFSSSGLPTCTHTTRLAKLWLSRLLP